MVLRIHPGIGLARVGNSSEYFIGPETVDLVGTPAGGYRDADGLMRRQASRFRLFDELTPVVIAADVSIQWTVNLKGVSASVSGADQVVSMMDGATLVAELRTDAQGNLLVLSCLIDGASTNGCCDGPVTATRTTGATTDAALAAWATIGPPDFAPGMNPRLPYTFLLLDWLVSDGLLTAPPAATNVSFRRDVWPAVRGRTSLSASDLLALPTVAARQAAVPFYTPRWGEVAGIEGAYLHSIVQHFHSGNFTNDWATPVPLVPDELDRGPLCFVDGSCPGSGWELGLLPIAAGDHPFASGGKLRFDPADVAEGVMNPFYGWTGDVGPCVLEWATIASAPGGYGMDWHIRGFMVKSGGSLEYQDWASRVDLVTTELDFGPVQRGSAVARMIELELVNFFEAAPFEIVAPLPPGVEIPVPVSTTGQTLESGSTKQVPVVFRADLDAALGAIPAASLELEIDGQSYFIPMTATIVEAERTQLALVLDCSSSMNEDRGDGLSKFAGLKAALEVVIDVARPHDGIAVAPFSDDALPHHVAQSFGDGGPGDSHRQAVRDFVDSLVTHSNTSIGDGLLSGRNVLTLTSAPFDREALLVVTDGKQTVPEWIEDVATSIDEFTFAVGIGTAANVDEDILTELTEGNEGYLLLTGNPTSAAKQYRLEKYLLQILAGATNEDVILDPTGTLSPGGIARIPIPVTEQEFRLDVMVVSDDAPELLLALVGPDGVVRPFESLASEPGVQVVRRRRVGMARVPVPFTMLDGTSWGAGTWYLVMAQRAHVPRGASHEMLKAHFSPRRSRDSALLSRGKAISYAAVVNARSAIRLTAHARHFADQRSRLAIEANVGWAGVPLPNVPSVIAEVSTPGGIGIDLPLEPAGPGRFLGELAVVRPGTYVTRVRARGLSPGAHRFVRELTLTPALSARRRPAHPCERERESCGTFSRCRAELARIVSCFSHERRVKG